MDWIKKNYEKVLLGAVLLGLAVVVGLLPLKISSEKQKLQELTSGVINPKVKPLTNLDLATPEAAIKRASTPATINLGAPNRLFNPMPWQKAADGHLILVDDKNVGPKAVTVTKLTPLYLRLTLDNVQVLDSGPKYVIGTEKEAAPVPRDRAKRQTYASVGTKNDTFTLREVQGPPESPTNVVLELRNGQTAEINREKPYSSIEGYMADLRYEPEKKTWRNQRIGSSLSLNNEEYNLVAISTNEIVLSAKSNQKKWIIPCNPTATTTTPEPR